MSVAHQVSTSNLAGSEPLPANGPAAATVVAAGIGCTTLGLAVVLVEASKTIEKSLNLYNPVGPLAGKTIIAVLAFFVSWVVLTIGLKDKNVNFRRWATIGLILIAVGFLLTFPPVFDLFAGH